MERQLVKTGKMCEILNISEHTLLRMKKRGDIPFVKMGKSHRYDVEKVISALEVKSKK